MGKQTPEKIKCVPTATKRISVLLSLLSVTQSVLAVFLAYVTRNVINAVVYGGAWKIWGVLLLVCSVCLPLLHGVSALLASRTADRTVCDLRLRLLSCLWHKDERELNRLHSGALLSRLTDDCRTLAERYTAVLPRVVGEISQLLGAVAVLSVLYGKLALAVFICGTAVGIGGLAVRRMLKERHRAVRRADDALISALAEELEQEELLRSAADGKPLLARIETRQETWYKERRKLRRLSVTGTSLFLLAVQIGNAALILWGARRAAEGVIGFGDFTAMIQLLSLFRSPLSGLTGIQARLAASDAAAERLSEIADLPEEEEILLPEGGLCPTALVFDGVTFFYEEEEGEVLSDFSARIDLTGWTCLTGMSGRGKSTLYRLILGLYHPVRGHVYVETAEGKRIPVSAATRSLFGFVPQSPVLFSGTVRENLLFAAPDADEEDIRHALEVAQCDFLRSLPDGMDTVVGQFGEGLSVGQRQRIAVARAVLTGRKILLLDEMTAALDSETACAVIDALRKEYPAAVFATHHPELLQGDEVAVLSLEDDDERA